MDIIITTSHENKVIPGEWGVFYLKKMEIVEWKIFLFLFLWNISGSFTFSGILSQFEESGGEEVLVNIQASSRSKRSTNGELHPDHFDLRFSSSGLQIHLVLHRNDRLTTDVPTFTLKDGKMEYERPNVSQTAVFYQDTINGGSFLVNFNGDKTETMYGVFQSNGSEFILQSNETKEDAPQRNGFRKFAINKARTININNDEDVKSYSWKGQKGKEMIRAKRIDTGRQKRASESYSVELFIVVDYAVYQRWLVKSSGATPTQIAKNAVASIRQYYAFVINGMEAMYKNIQKSSFTINILFAGIVIAQTPSAATWTESIRIQSVVPNQIPAHTALNNFRSWITNDTQTNLSGFDHAMLFTGYEMIHDDSSSVTGYAFVSSMCTTHSQSIVEDKFNFLMISVASHELGHSLGAAHDGTGNTCRDNDSYIMSSVAMPQSNALTAANPWKFSSCSTSYFKSYIDSLTTRNQQCLTTLSPYYDPNFLASERQRLPGQIYDADQQCVNMAGDGADMCSELYSGNYSTICTVLWCSDPKNTSICRGYIAGDGTLCGDRKWCISGVCTSLPNTTSGSGNVSVTPAPVTPAPVTPAPVTPAPVTPVPVTPAPVTPASVTPAPVTPAPVTPAPVTPAPVTPAPVTSAPVTPTPNPTGSTPAQTTIVAQQEKNWWTFTDIYGILGVAAGGIVLLVIILVVMVCCCQRRKPTTRRKKTKPQQTSSNTFQLSYATLISPSEGYVNRAMVDDNVMRQPVQQGQRSHSYLQFA